MQTTVVSAGAPVAGRGKKPPASRFVRLTSPVRNRRGGFSPLKTSVFALLFVPGLVLAYQYFAGQLGARPVLALVHGTGLWTLRLLVLTLALSPARWLLDWPESSALRRMIGVGTACYAVCHLSLYVAQQNFHVVHVGAEILHRFYLTIGFVALLALVALAATSTDGMMKRMGRNWKRLHRAIYGVAGLGLLHFFLQAKAEVFQAVIVAGLVLWLLAWRLVPARFRASLWAPVALGVFATLGSAGLEYAWYALGTHVNALRVFAANFHFAHWRPSVYVALWSLGAFVVIALVRSAGAIREKLNRPPAMGAADRA
jgi:sulfoxide reductase heme-binding subunit YedZ